MKTEIAAFLALSLVFSPRAGAEEQSKRAGAVHRCSAGAGLIDQQVKHFSDCTCQPIVRRFRSNVTLTCPCVVKHGL